MRAAGATVRRGERATGGANEPPGWTAKELVDELVTRPARVVGLSGVDRDVDDGGDLARDVEDQRLCVQRRPHACAVEQPADRVGVTSLRATDRAQRRCSAHVEADARDHRAALGIQIAPITRTVANTTSTRETPGRRAASARMAAPQSAMMIRSTVKNVPGSSEARFASGFVSRAAAMRATGSSRPPRRPWRPRLGGGPRRRPRGARWIKVACMIIRSS
jgi:hypothetical protein